MVPTAGEWPCRVKRRVFLSVPSMVGILPAIVGSVLVRMELVE